MIVLDTNIIAKNATTQYTDFNFNSLCRFGHNFYCASEDGLYQVEGSSRLFASDDSYSEIVTSYFEPITMDFGTSNQKRLRAAYIGYEADGNLTLKIKTEMSSEQSYALSATTSGRYARKVVVSRALKGRYWTFQIYGSGVVYSIDSIKVLPIYRGHGFDQN